MFWDSDGYDVGDYEAKFTVNFNEKKYSRSFFFRIYEEPVIDQNMLYIAVLVVAIIIIAVLVARRKKKKRGEWHKEN